MEGSRGQVDGGPASREPDLHKESGDSAVRLALAGPPNVGKSTVFNLLTGLNQHVGNWPGKTIEKKTGRFQHQGRWYEIVDLPGTYSLTSGSEEERVARDYLIREPPQVVITVVNAATLERDLYLVAELLLLPVPLVVGLNMVDVAESQGVKVDAKVLEAALGVPVVELVASRGKGVRELVEAATRLAERPDLFSPNRPTIREKHRSVLAEIERLLGERAPAGYPQGWVALKLLEGDPDVADLVRKTSPETWAEIHHVLVGHDDAFLDIAGGRYDWIGRMVRAAVDRPRWAVTGVTDRIDRVATHPFWGLVLLLAALAVLFSVTYLVAGPAAEALSGVITGPFSDLLRSALEGAPRWLSGALVDGAVAGAGTVLSFLPILVVFFVALGFLEDVGYMTRAAYVTDRYMHWMGLHGKSCLPLVLGFGCNVPAIYGSRIIEERRARLLTMILTPFVPCTGRLAVLAFLAPAFFGSRAPWVALALVGGNLVVLGLVGVAVNRLIFRGQRSALIMEMPLYHAPNARTIGLYVWRNTLSFLRKAGTLIVIVSIVVWALSHYPGEDPKQSVLGLVGRALEPVGALMGLGDWRLVVALLSSFLAKENVVATLGVLFGGTETVGEAGATLATRVASILGPAAAVAFLVVQMTFVPCVATVAAIRQEAGSWRWPAINVGLMLVLAFMLGVVVYQVGSLF